MLEGNFVHHVRKTLHRYGCNPKITVALNDNLNCIQWVVPWSSSTQGYSWREKHPFWETKHQMLGRWGTSEEVSFVLMTESGWNMSNRQKCLILSLLHQCLKSLKVTLKLKENRGLPCQSIDNGEWMLTLEAWILNMCFVSFCSIDISR